MKKNEYYEGEVLSLKFPNKGLVKIAESDVPVQVKNTLPGQRVRFQLKKARKARPEGNLTEVLKKSPLENTTPPCPHFADCGGCAYQTMDYENQKELKLSQVRELLKTVCPELSLDECLASPRVWEYRNKMEFSFGDARKDGPLTLGLHKRGSFYDIVPVPGCQIVDEDIRKILEGTLNFFREREERGEKIPFYHKMRHKGILRHLLVRKGLKTGELLIGLVTTSQGEAPLKPFQDMLLNLPLTGSIAGILHITNDSLSDVVKSEETKILYGRDYFYEELLGLRFKISPFSFFQTNSAGAEVLYQTAREYAGETKDKVIFDLYSGTGTIAQILAPAAKQVVGVEIVEEAVAAARENAKENQLDNCSFFAGDVLTVMDELKEVPDFVVLDPPREGIHPKALSKILKYEVRQILYISCKPTSLARDLEMFLEHGYRPVKAQCVDMFPWTRNIETILLLERENKNKISDYI
ncbi:MAG: 23S rRNA (uracil(1939)-C(5))-methyltransferase RlmD [Lachnospiraceae bacterium]|nr:23S rRNA (uracil(1939)-C(5))-methyltransferase RlmD [Lachnospiraceae bacterium]